MQLDNALLQMRLYTPGNEEFQRVQKVVGTHSGPEKKGPLASASARLIALCLRASSRL